ncbi:MAG: RNA methyltransferase [Vicingaceae bacterium]|nr:MAG: RNA methyltransferase [Vicingaceae bacterium]
MIELLDDFEDARFMAKCQQGIEEILAEELHQLGARDIKTGNRAVFFSCDRKTLYRLHISLRTAQKIIYPLIEATIDQPKQLYELVKSFSWDQVMKVHHTFKIDSVVNSSLYKHTLYPALLMKDAICDYFREKNGKRPDIDKDNPKLILYLGIRKNKVFIGIDTTGELLHRRKYRVFGGQAPIKEDLAAALILKTGWRGECDFVDLFCGSGTFLIEAAMIASRRSPNISRSNFAFMQWNNYDERIMKQVIREAEEEVIQPKIKITGCDINPKAIEGAKRNIIKSGMISWISLKNTSFEQIKKTSNNGVIVSNLPYEVRLKSVSTKDLYKLLGFHLKKEFSDWDAWLLTADKKSSEFLKLKPQNTYEFFNGKIKVYFSHYPIMSFN